MVRLCRELNIDDPVAWMDAVPPHVVDLWIAFYLNEADQGKEKESMSPENLLERLSRKHG